MCYFKKMDKLKTCSFTLNKSDGTCTKIILNNEAWLKICKAIEIIKKRLPEYSSYSDVVICNSIFSIGVNKIIEDEKNLQFDDSLHVRKIVYS